MALQTKTLQKWVAWFAGAAIVISLVVWFTRRDTSPIRIAAGPRDSLYKGLLSAARSSLEARTGRIVIILETNGSADNRRRLLDGKADMALIQGDMFARHDEGSNIDGVVFLAPLFPEVVHVIARRDRGIETIQDLDGKSVYLGRAGSGSRLTAEHLLAYFDLEVHQAEGADESSDLLLALSEDNVDAAIVTTGVLNAALRQVFAEGEFVILAVPEARGLGSQTALLREFEIPQGLYSGSPTIPATAKPTLATTAILVAQRGIPNRVVNQILPTFYEEGLQLDYPILIARDEALAWSPVALHEASRAYFNPIDRLGWISAVMESLAATKELLFALGAGLYLLWRRWKRMKDREIDAALRAQKDHLDQFLSKTLKIEESQISCTDPDTLQSCLDEVTRIKLEALQEFTEEELRADHSFSIFLMQCANLMNKIQLKLISATNRTLEEQGRQ
jgi:TRAP transporter TAXI family solute receptor